MKKTIILLLMLILTVVFLTGCQESIETKYTNAQALMAEGKYAEAAEKFESLGSYEESSVLTMYCKAAAAGERGDYDTAFNGFRGLGEYKDSRMMLDYYSARSYEDGNWQNMLRAAAMYEQNSLFRDSASRAENCRKAVYEEAQRLKSFGDYDGACDRLDALGSYQNAASQIPGVRYQQGAARRETEDWDGAVAAFRNAGDYSDAAVQVKATYYAEGEAKRTSGDWDGAVTAFRNAGNYSDAAAQITETRYLQAKVLTEKGNYIGAAVIFIDIKGYKDVDSLLTNDQNLSAVVAAARDAKYAVGNHVTFGHYPQTSGGNDSTEIEWLVLARDGNKALLISRYGLDVQPYNIYDTDITWEKCTLRTWLNDTFLNKAFTAQEQAGILLTNVDNSSSQGYWSSTDGGNNTQDKIFLLSIKEANKYFGVMHFQASGSNDNTRSRVSPTAYVLEQGTFTINDYKTTEGTAAGSWWLRSPGVTRRHAAYVFAAGSLSSSSDNRDRRCVRPALWINLESVENLDAHPEPETPASEANLASFRNVGGYVTFGHYEQDNIADNGQEPIEWLVLDYDAANNRALLISRYGLDVKPYNTEWVDITWENCTLRAWLNGEFMSTTFSTIEQGAILTTSVDNSSGQGYSVWYTDGGNNTQNKIFLLSYAEANKYLGVTDEDTNNTKSQVAPTAYAIKNGAYTNNDYQTSEGDAAGFWWLRSPGYFQYSAACVDNDGSLGSYAVAEVVACVRPVLWINLESDIF